MKTVFKSIAILLMISLFFGCSKEDNNAVLTLPPTTLKIIVNDDSGNAASQAQVKLYLSQTDLINNTNQILATQTTNSNGEVSFSPVSNLLTYYWLSSKDCKTSVFDTNNNHNNLFLSSNSVNTYSTTISDKGILTFTNNSSNPYNLYVNNVLKISNMPGGTTNSYFYSPGNYSIRVEQQSGYIFNPTIITYTGTLNCGSTLTTTFPN